MAKLLQMPLLFENPGPTEPTPDLPLPQLESAPDADQRAQALDIQRSWIVEAPAGSGKTGLLIQRFLKLLAYGGVDQPDEILAITFTRKADAEMRRRAMGQLAAAAENAPLAANAGAFERSTRQLALAALERDRALGWRLLESPRGLNIRTIDSLCAEVAGSRPLLAGASLLNNPTNDPDPVYELAAQRTLLHMGGTDAVLTSDLESLLLHRDANPGDFSRLLAGMLGQREQWAELIPLDPNLLTETALDEQVRPRLTRTLERLVGQELEAAAELAGHGLLRSLATLAHNLSACPSYNGDPHLLSACTHSADMPLPDAASLAHWKCLVDLILTGAGEWRASLRKNHLRLDLTPAEQQHLQYLIASFQDREQAHPNLRRTLADIRNLPQSPYPDEQWQTVKALCRVLRTALSELQAVFSERRVCDFTEIALLARTQLRSRSAEQVKPLLGHLKHLLVDEMQDTSASQYELLKILTHGWDGLIKTLFLVGDPKQSIYEFRQARVERFLRIVQTGRLGKLPLGTLRLTANFRSQSALIEALNLTFSQVFALPDDLALPAQIPDVPFVAAEATRPATSTPALHWHIPAPEPNLEKATSDTAARQARLIRDTVEQYLAQAQHRQPASSERPHETRKVAVLARNRAHLAPIIQEFHQDRGLGPLAFRAVNVETLGERPEILDLLALTRALLHPADRVAWLAVLRSPVCGLSLADLLTLTGEGAEADPDATVPHLISTRGHLLSFAADGFLQRARSVLLRALDDLGRTPLATHVERTWRSLGADAPLQSHERANALHFLNLLHELESGPDPLSLNLLHRRLRTLYAEPNAPSASVELMTIHKAKGLEWDLVLIPALHRGSGRNTHEFLKWLEFDSSDDSGEEADFLLAPIQIKGEESSALSKWLTRRQCQREAAEAKRLLYVACTRAREELHLFADVALTSTGALASPKPDSLLQAAWPAVEPAILQQSQAATPSADALAFPVRPTHEPSSESLALAAAGDGSYQQSPDRSPLVQRLPLSYDPLSRFRAEAGTGLAYPPAASLQSTSMFLRPHASFAARAFGNVVHRFLDRMALRLSNGQSLPSLRAELSSWGPRLITNLRTEGLSLSQATAEAQRALSSLRATADDPAGAWLLGPQTQARNESPVGGTDSPLRADRTFRAGPLLLNNAPPTHLWIVDYKTAEPDGRPLQKFLADQRLMYLAQMGAYAKVARTAGLGLDKVVLALYFPLVPALVHWPANDESDSLAGHFVRPSNTFGSRNR